MYKQSDMGKVVSNASVTRGTWAVKLDHVAVYWTTDNASYDNPSVDKRSRMTIRYLTANTNTFVE